MEETFNGQRFSKPGQIKGEKRERRSWDRGFGEIKDDEREWNWRIFYGEPERYRQSFRKPMGFTDLMDWLAFYQEWWVRESQSYPEWRAKAEAEVKLVYPSDDEDQLGDLWFDDEGDDFGVLSLT
ncbi:hypothetical protein LTR62_000955 [Meristemomyces frigidus]|uniref:Uncharacterized protein n=1 Tax=Meristemomyces frigidus TaxID=1508187 RepID=A0AAN7T8T1_9PEZI|nr:hypothetical protein LTR62_000955 [Meristemomyces frigidus]